MPKKLIDWSETPSKKESRIRYDLIRCPKTSTGPWLITSEKHIGCQLYWMTGRSNPHLADQDNGPHLPPTVVCPGCAADRAHRWNGWLCVYDERKLQHCILEITPYCLGPINEYILNVGTLRGARIRLFRPNGKFNGAINAEIMRSELTLPQIPQPFDLQAEMLALWEAPGKEKKVKLETPRVVEEPKEVKDLRKARKSTIYEATPEQLDMIAANRTAAAARITAGQMDSAEKSGKATRAAKTNTDTDDEGRMTKEAREKFQAEIAATKKQMKKTNGHKTR